MAKRSQLLKGILDACVMSLLEEKPIYGYELSKLLQQVGSRDISEGTFTRCSCACRKTVLSIVNYGLPRRGRTESIII